MTSRSHVGLKCFPSADKDEQPICTYEKENNTIGHITHITKNSINKTNKGLIRTNAQRNERHQQTKIKSLLR